MAITLLAASLLVGGVAFAAAPGRLEILGFSAPVPPTWLAQAPGSAMRLAQFSLAGDPGATLVVYYFGRGQGGSPERNIARWTSQFSGPGGAAVRPRTRVLREAAPRVTIVRLEGTYRRGIGSAADAVAVPGQTLLAAIVQDGHETAFVQLYGPTAAVESHVEALERFLLALEPV